MSRPDLLALAERVERAVGPDRELDRSIAEAVGVWPPDDFVAARGGARRYTESLDAAMTLLPPEWFWTTGELWSGPFGKVVFPLPSGGWRERHVKAATPALALLAAILRARAVMEDAT